MGAIDKKRDPVTKDFDGDVTSIVEPHIPYHPIPYSDTAGKPGSRPVWRVRFELASDTSKCFGLDINGEVVLGRGKGDPNAVDLTPFGAADMGVSRRHMMLRPTSTNLYVLDLNSTNGTWHNGREIGPNAPYSLGNGDTIMLGKLEFMVRIIERPMGQTAALKSKADLADALIQTAKAITSQLEVEQVLNQVAQMAMTLTDAGETGIWLVDEKSGQLKLEAQHGIAEEEEIRRISLPVTDTLAGKVIRSGKPLRTSREVTGEQIKIKTGYLVESLVYVPITLGGVHIGVLMAVHREVGKEFDARDERVLVAIADFAAIAVQNSRIYQATDQALAERVRELAALNELSHAVSSSLDLTMVHDVLVSGLHKHWDVQRVVLWLVDEESKHLHAFSEDEKEIMDMLELLEVQITEVIERVAAKGEPEIAELIEIDQQLREEGKEGTGKMQAQTLACVPLLVKKEVVGVLALFNKRKGRFTDADLDRLAAFASPVATAIENARLFSVAEQVRATVDATVNTLPQPLLILNDEGGVIVSNEAANRLLETHMSQVFEGLSSGVGRTTEVAVGEETFITTTEHSPQVGTIIIMQDITYVKRLEEARAEFVNAFSHDLKSPISSIKGWTYLLDQFGEDDEKRHKFVSQIGQTSERVLGMIDELLDIALLSEAPKAHHRACDLVEVVDKVMNDLEGAAMAKTIALSCEQEGKGYRIQGDPTRLYRSALNLVDNAIKYSPEGSSVLVRLDFGEEKVLIQVRDNGEGIPEEDIPRLFDKYYRGKQTHGSKTGVGLGLVVVQATARSHGGDVSVRNMEEGGVEFTISLPASLRIAE